MSPVSAIRGLLEKKATVYGLLAVAWLALAWWQAAEHARVRDAAARALSNQAREMSAVLGVVMRSQGRFGAIPQSKLEAALNELVDSSEVLGVALLDAEGDVTAKAGEEDEGEYHALLTRPSHWRRDTATFVNLVALGPGTEPDTLIIPQDEERPGPRGPGPPPGGGRGQGRHGGRGLGPPNEMTDPEHREALEALTDGEPVTKEELDAFLSNLPDFMLPPGRAEEIRARVVGRSLDRRELQDVLRPGREHRRGGGPPMHRPPWLAPGEYERLVQERGVYWLVVTLPTRSFVTESRRDLQARIFVVIVALLACGALALAWRALGRASRLEVELVRAAEEARHLQELNMAAAGLVHETKNPLNLIRGMAQMITHVTDLPEDTRDRALKITEESDRVTGRLNQFLAYSRPAAPKLSAVSCDALFDEICDLLAQDAAEQSVILAHVQSGISIDADPGMLRQVLFNLVINALHVTPANGSICLGVRTTRDHGAVVEVCDDGPGVPVAQREEIFRPYHTTSETGTGLGLAVVRQLVAAHGWHIVCEDAPAGGACFRVSGIRVAKVDGRT